MNRQTGFTTIELMVTLAIVAIVLVIAIPTFRYITNSYRMSAEVNGLLGDLEYARAEAIKEGQGVTVCTSSNGGATCSASNSWQNGWVVYSNGTGVANPPVGSVLRVQAAFTGAFPDTFVSNPAVSAITYNREGFATTAAGFPNTTITLQESTLTQAWTRCLLINTVGMPSTTSHVTNAATCI
jgi:type IV fimbrial biogenesis protein FimT